MSSSYTRFKESGFWSSDAMLAIWLRTLSLSISEEESIDHELLSIRNHWLAVSSIVPPGLIDSRIDNIENQKSISIIINGCERALKNLNSYGKIIDQRTLRLMGVGVYFSNGVQTSEIVNVGNDFMSLLKSPL